MMRPFLLVLLASSWCFAQNYPKDYFSSPLKIDLIPSGTFGELRNNHFHAGLDIRTQQRIGLPIYAPADGTVSRIKVSTFGYGKALYINHPGGYTTVYGHLNAYNQPIGDFVRNQQYAAKKFEIELFPRAGELRVKKGELIGFTGNTGGSGGPHLHYEFRDTKTEKIINPLHFGPRDMVKDSQSPIVNGLLVYPIGDQAVVNQSQKPVALTLTKQQDGSFLTNAVRGVGNIGFAVNAYDKSDINSGNNGIYAMETFLNGAAFYSYQFDTFAFDESRFVNALIDYERYIKTKQRFQKLFFSKPYGLSLIRAANKGNGQLSLAAAGSWSYRIEISDFNKNKTIIHVPIDYAEEAVVVKETREKTDLFIQAERDYIFERENVVVEFPANVFYDDFYLKLAVKDQVLQLHDETVALHKNITIKFDLTNAKGINLEKAFIGRVSNGKKEYFTTQKKNGVFSIRTRDFGQYQIFEDAVAPQITKPNFVTGAELDRTKKLVFSVSDALSGMGQIEAFINDKWVLMDYDYKTNLIEHALSDGVATTGKNDIKIIATDRMGNTATFESYFFIK
ncbi:M23 family metallopeptidase [Flavobacterium sp. JP2137]|uniref:M23 family metallopeptidase n=1 Tax=Flavobacterium sp. JP2137 TaxID=3414510 RepID=UPI003D300B49